MSRSATIEVHAYRYPFDVQGFGLAAPRQAETIATVMTLEWSAS
jgi:hypothetical protein